MTGDLAVAAGPLTAAKEQESLPVVGNLQGQVQELVRRRGVGDLDVRAGASLDAPVAEGLQPAVAARPQQLLEGVALEGFRPDGAADSDVHEQGRLEAPARLDGIDGLDKLGRVVAPTVVAPSEEGRDHRQQSYCSSFIHEYPGV
jgi:hypothetical protein